MNNGRHRASGAAKVSRYVLIAAPLVLLVVIVVGLWANMTSGPVFSSAPVPQPLGLTASGGSLPPAAPVATATTKAKAKLTTAPTTAPPAPVPAVPQVAVVQFGLTGLGNCVIQNGEVKPGVKVVACFVEGKTMFVVITSDEGQSSSAPPSSSAAN